jgi:hypothetical protein
VQEAVMSNRKPEELMFETAASCILLVTVTAITWLLYELITLAVPVLESMVLSR